jgi:ketosteroid isomerase-like protein
MPWFPDFTSAMALAREETRVTGQADPVRQYITALNNGDAHALEDVWPGEVIVYDPREGEVRGHRRLQQFISRSQAMLARRHAVVDIVATTVAGGRAVMELLAHLDGDGDDQRVPWAAAVVAESRDDRSVVFRSYFSRWPLDRQHHVRPPLLSPGRAEAGDVVGRYLAALQAGDAEAVVSTFEPDGYYREPDGPGATHRGTAELRSFFAAQLPASGVGLEQCAVTDDGVRCALEYNILRWGDHVLAPQAGLGVYERGPDGLLAAARVYDDAERGP